LYTSLWIEAAQLDLCGRYEIPRYVARVSRFAHVLCYSCTQCGLGRVTGSRSFDATALRHSAFQNYRSDHESDVGQLLPRFLEPDVTAVHAVSMYPFATDWLPSEYSPFDAGIVLPRSANSARMLDCGLSHAMSPHIFASGSIGRG